MQPDQQKNYWSKDDDSATDQKPEVYTPTADETIDDEKIENTSYKNDTQDEKDVVHWEAEEYIHEDKGVLWFAMFFVVAFGLIAVDIFLIKSYTFSILVAVMAVALFIYSRRPPQMIDYTLSGDHGLYVGNKLYRFEDFKAFGVVNDAGRNSIVFIPVKRFSPGVTVFIPAESGEAIVDILGARLPMEKIKPDFLDKVVKKLHI